MLNRRDFLEFLGRSAVVGTALGSLPSCVTAGPKGRRPPGLPFAPIAPSAADQLTLAEGFSYDIVLRWRQRLNNKGDLFGFNNDYLAYIPLDPRNPFEGLMWVNHEYHDPYFCSGWRPGQPRTAAQVAIERKEVGGSIVHLRKLEGQWRMVEGSKYNRRLDAFTRIPFVSSRPILGKRAAIGTFANCAGGVTPWGTVLSAEENYYNFVGEAVLKNGKRTVEVGDKLLSWLPHVDLPPEHYGWIVEIDLKTGSAKKLCALGRFAHECATTIVASDGRTVVYSGEDDTDEHIYKFIAAKPGSLDQGTLYVADTVKGRWLPLDIAQDPRLRKAYKDQLDLLIHTRDAAKIVGATPLDRPEDIEIDPATRNVIVSLTGNKKQGRPFGSLLKIEEAGGDPLSMEFRASTLVAGGAETGFACPDNLAFDRKGNLWMTTDMSGSVMHRDPFTAFANNGLFFIPMSGPSAGQAFQVASAPVGAELTGPLFSHDGKTLFLSVQHPGEIRDLDPKRGHSHWPDGGQSVPAPCVVAISGPALEAVNGV